MLLFIFLLFFQCDRVTSQTSKIIPMLNLINYTPSSTSLTNASLGDCFSACVQNNSQSTDCVGVYYFYTNTSCQLIASIQKAQCSGEQMSKSTAILYVRVNLILNKYIIGSCTPNKAAIVAAVKSIITKMAITNC